MTGKETEKVLGHIRLRQLPRTSNVIARIDSYLNHVRLWLYAAALGTLYAGIVLFVVVSSERTILAGDFSAFYSGGYFIAHDDLSRIYDIEYHHRIWEEIVGPGKEDVYFFWLYPPFMAYFFVPFVVLPFSTARFPFMILSAGLLADIIYGLWRTYPHVRSRVSFSTVLIIAFASAPVINLLLSGQITTFSLGLFAGGLWLLLRNRDISAGSLLGVGVFKPPLFLLVPVLFLLLRRWYALASWFVVASILTLLSVWVVGLEGARAYAGVFQSDLYSKTLVASLAGMMISIPGLLNYLIPAASFPDVMPFLITVGGISLSAAVLWLSFRGVPIEVRNDSKHLNFAFALIILLALLSGSHTMIYDATLLTIPALVLLEYRPSRGLKFSLILGFFLLGTMLIRDALVSADTAMPLRAVGASWVQIPMLFMCYWIYQLIRNNGSSPSKAGSTSEP